MSAAFDYEDLHHLVDRLTPEQLRRLRLLVDEDVEMAAAAQPSALGAAGTFRLSGLIGAIDGPADLAERHDGYVRDRRRDRFPGAG